MKEPTIKSAVRRCAFCGEEVKPSDARMDLTLKYLPNKPRLRWHLRDECTEADPLVKGDVFSVAVPDHGKGLVETVIARGDGRVVYSNRRSIEKQAAT